MNQVFQNYPFPNPGICIRFSDTIVCNFTSFGLVFAHFHLLTYGINRTRVPG